MADSTKAAFRVEQARAWLAKRMPESPGDPDEHRRLLAEHIVAGEAWLEALIELVEAQQARLDDVAERLGAVDRQMTELVDEARRR